jgi:hypothetical protein
VTEPRIQPASPAPLQYSPPAAVPTPTRPGRSRRRLRPFIRNFRPLRRYRIRRGLRSRHRYRRLRR